MIFCDHNPLQYIKESATKSAKLLRWSLALAEFDIDITYTKGSENVVADYLSRMWNYCPVCCVVSVIVFVACRNCCGSLMNCVGCVEWRLFLVSRDDVSPEYALSRVGCAALSFVAQWYIYVWLLLLLICILCDVYWDLYVFIIVHCLYMNRWFHAVHEDGIVPYW